MGEESEDMAVAWSPIKGLEQVLAALCKGACEISPKYARNWATEMNNTMINTNAAETGLADC